MTTQGVDLDSLGPGTYPARKVACEAMVRQNCGPRGLIVRPCVIAGAYDSSDRFTYWAARMQRGGKVLAPHAATEPVQWIDAGDLAEWMLTALEAHREGVYNTTGPTPAQGFGKLLQDLNSNADSELVWAPQSFLEKVGVQPWQDLPLWVPSQSENAGFTQVSNHKAGAAGLCLRSAATSAAQILAWRQTDPAPLRAGLTPEREQEVIQQFLQPRP